MSKAAEKADRRRVKYQHNANALERLLYHFANGDERDDAGAIVNAERLTELIVSKYRAMGQCLQDKMNGVSYDGPLSADIEAALVAAIERGKK
jgi:TPP-dependent pyruvate/acetoin dehydrogenase alpha subunit